MSDEAKKLGLVLQARAKQSDVEYLERELAATRRQRNSLVRRAHQAGVSMRAIADELGTTAQSVSRWTEEAS